MSGALETGLALEVVTHAFLLSDGEPHAGIEDPTQVRAMVKERNRKKARILALALGLGEQFKGMALLRALAEENTGKFSYVNLSK